MTEDAIAWAVKTGDPSFEDWDAFTLWLEADPEHARAYDRAVAAVADAAEADLPSRVVNDDASLPGVGASAPGRGVASQAGRWRWAALAATVVLVAMVGFLQLRGSGYTIETEAGETLVVPLDDGSEIALGGGARVTLDRDRPRFAVLERGRALFTVRHDESDPFTVSVGEETLVDAGTVFDVTRAGTTTSVAVSEGVVLVNPGRKPARLEPGDMLSVTDGSDAYRRSTVPVARIGEWQTGRLTFDNAPLGEIARELSASTGIAFAAAPAVAGRRATGSVALAPLAQDPQAVGPLFGVAVRRKGDSWMIDSR
ncbi:FecR domain-containing protein [Pelagerythrobacter marensis]|uniref:FecR domain-containing protein n=1 Tax=Pelagerythrobacter marensis TaxID=543877 RepID=A0ABZ2D3B9_9SPHN